MKRRFVACLTLMCVISFSRAPGDQPPTPAKPPVEVVPRANVSEGSPPPKAVPRGHVWDGSESVVIEWQIWQVHGDEQRTLKDAGFRQSGGLLRIGGGRDGENMGLVNSIDRLVQQLGRNGEITGVVGPKMTTRLGQKTGVKMGLGSTGKVPYLVRTGETTFELKYAAQSADFGFTMDLTPRALPDDPDRISISPLQISFTTVDGREPIRGVDLEIGKPIVSTRKLETSIAIVDSGDALGVVLPGPEGRQPILLIAVHRVQEP